MAFKLSLVLQQQRKLSSVFVRNQWNEKSLNYINGKKEDRLREGTNSSYHTRW